MINLEKGVIDSVLEEAETDSYTINKFVKINNRNGVIGEYILGQVEMYRTEFQAEASKSPEKDYKLYTEIGKAVGDGIAKGLIRLYDIIERTLANKNQSMPKIMNVTLNNVQYNIGKRENYMDYCLELLDDTEENTKTTILDLVKIVRNDFEKMIDKPELKSIPGYEEVYERAWRMSSGDALMKLTVLYRVIELTLNAKFLRNS